MPDLDKLRKLKDQRNYARLIDWANYTKDPVTSRQAKALIAEDPYDLAEYLYETVQWTRKNSGHSGRRLPRRGINLLRQITGMAVTLGEPMLVPLADSVRAYPEYGDPDIKTKLLYYSVVFDTLTRMGGIARQDLEALSKEKDPDVRKLARQALKDLPDDEEDEEEWDEWDDDDEEDEYDDEDAEGEEDR
jgi:hypothetical protein